ncbi:hypothetical protein [Actinocatenispora rupis]|uniref:Uncharacterized protein n=1 Tax=Actinocatenispora rupis TaxID=519421 RepID=A0A8J3JBS0_9ACTN|nr:hypothetical protein [Actinocatenispora rupis]GID11898.1 hypothetical protein Aru02nite_27870 [Actinocatenispora rupis]
MFWQTAAGQTLLGFLSNLLFIVVLTTFGVGYLRIVLTRRSRPLRRLLFGGRTPRAVVILVSSIYVVPGGTLGVRSRSTGFYGPVMNQSEYVSALRLAEAIQTRPAARLLRALLNQLGLVDTGYDPLDCSIAYSPQYVESMDGGPVSAREYTVPDLSGNGEVAERIRRALATPGTYVLVGGPFYNAAVHYALTHLGERTRFRFVARTEKGTEVRGISVLGYRQDGTEQTFEQHLGTAEDIPGPDYDYFVLQKVSGFGPAGATVVLCCGLSSLATALAVGLLATHWEDLAREFGADDFALLYQFDNGRDLAVPSRQDVDVALAGVQRVWPRPPDTGLG